MGNKIYKVEELKSELTNIRNNGVKRGAYTGLESLYKKYSMKLGSTTYIYAAPHQGKTNFAFEMMVNTAEYNGWRWVLYSPETGSPAQVYSELLWVYLRKPFLVNDKVTATDEEVERAFAFIEKHFYIIDSGLDNITVKGIYNEVEKIESTDGKIQGVLIDPFTEVQTEVESGVRDDIAIGKELTKIRKFSQDRNIHTVVTLHTKYIAPRYKNEVAYIPKPTMSDIAGGQMWSRKGFIIINIWRCPFGLQDQNGIDYEPNQVEITIQKAKPKIVGNLGVVTLYYDKMMNRYYEKDDLGNPVFAHQDPDIDYDNDEVFITKDGKREEAEIVEAEVEQTELDF